jgi:hypothetical protein
MLTRHDRDMHAPAKPLAPEAVAGESEGSYEDSGHWG